MSEKIKSSLFGAVLGAGVTFATIFITTGSYKHKVDTNCRIVLDHESRIDIHESRLTGVELEVKDNKEMLSEVRADIKTLLRRTE